MDFLQSTGALENNWIVLTSDHGELFERGLRGHQTPMLYEPLIRVPLLIFEPGREDAERRPRAHERRRYPADVAARDGQPAAGWAEGEAPAAVR